MEKKQRYFHQFVAGIGILGLAFGLSCLLAASLPIPIYSPWRPVLASVPLFLPTLFVGFTIARAIALAVNEMDELEQRIQLEAFALSLASTAVLAFTVGLVQVFNEMRVSYAYVPLIAAAFWGIGYVRTRRRYR